MFMFYIAPLKLAESRTNHVTLMGLVKYEISRYCQLTTRTLMYEIEHQRRRALYRKLS